jgi:hypothetical protein
MRIYIASALAILALLLLVEGQRGFGRSYSDLVCTRCGKYREIKRRYGITTVDRVDDSELSKWLSQHRSGTCKHDWDPIAGGRGRGHWDGGSPLYDALREIHRLHPVIGEAETRKLLDRYYEIVDIPDRADRSSKLKPFRKELGETSLATGFDDRAPSLHGQTGPQDLSAVEIDERIFHPAQDGKPATLYLVLTAKGDPHAFFRLAVLNAQEALESLDEHAGSGPDSRVVFFVRPARDHRFGSVSSFSRDQLKGLTQLPEEESRWIMLEPTTWVIRKKAKAIPDS